MGRKRKQQQEQYQPPSSRGIEWDMAPEEPLNLTRVVMEAAQKLSIGGEAEIAIRLIGEYQKLCNAFDWHAKLIGAYHEIGHDDGIIKGFKFGDGVPDRPPKGSFAAAVWKQLRVHPGITNTTLIRQLEFQRREIDVPANYAIDIPPHLSRSFPNAWKYSHPFQQFISEQRKLFEKHEAAKRLKRGSTQDVAETSSAPQRTGSPVKPRKRLQIDEI